MWMVTLIASAVALIIIIWDLIDAGSTLYGPYLSFGIYIADLSAIGVLVSAFIFRSATDNIRDGFESLKKDINNRIKNTSSHNTTTITILKKRKILIIHSYPNIHTDKFYIKTGNKTCVTSMLIMS